MGYFGDCEGGPLGGRRLYHGEPAFPIGRDRLSKRILIGWRGGITDDVEVGYYEHDGGGWVWSSPKSLDESKPNL